VASQIDSERAPNDGLITKNTQWSRIFIGD